MVHLRRTVLNDDVNGQVLAKILRGLSFTCTGRTLRGATLEEVEGVGQRHVSLICKVSDNEATVVALVLVTVVTLEIELRADDAHHVLIASLSLLLVSKLLLPLEVLGMDRLIGEELVNDISVMLLHDDHSLSLLAVTFPEFVSTLLYNLNVSFNLLLVDGTQLLEWVVGVGARIGHHRCKCGLDNVGPLDLVVGQKDLTKGALDVFRHVISVHLFATLRARSTLGID